MATKTTLNKILGILSPDGTEVDFSEFDGAIDKLKEGLKEKVQAKTLDDVNIQLDNFRKRFDFAPLQQALRTVETTLDTKIDEITSKLEGELQAFRDTGTSEKQISSQQLAQIAADISESKTQLEELVLQRDSDVKDIRARFDALPDVFKKLNDAVEGARTEALTYRADDSKADKTVVDAFNETLNKVRQELTNRINNIPRGGNANRNIAVGGNTSVLSMFTDINLKAGAGTTLTYSNNKTTKYLDLTITATGSGSGITRSINSISSNTIAGAVAAIDYVYLVSGTTTLTLPTAVGNTNLYTVKNVGSGVATIATTGVETIDGGSTIVMPVRYTSVDLLSDGSNWEVT